MKDEITKLPDAVKVLIVASSMLTGGLLFHCFGSGEGAALLLEVFCILVGALALFFALASLFTPQTTLLFVNTLFSFLEQEKPTSSFTHAETRESRFGRKTRLEHDRLLEEIAIQRTTVRCALFAKLVLIFLPEMIENSWVCVACIFTA